MPGDAMEVWGLEKKAVVGMGLWGYAGGCHGSRAPERAVVGMGPWGYAGGCHGSRDPDDRADITPLWLFFYHHSDEYPVFSL